MHYEGTIIRPPSEANSILLQVAVGCSHNKCTFCGTYPGERFRFTDLSVVQADIGFAADHCRRQRRIFLCGGDGLILPMKRLVTILDDIRQRLPWVTRVGIYGNAKSIGMKTDAELAQLRDRGIGIVYMGLESGDDDTLTAIRKGASAERIVAMGKRIRAAGMKLSVTVLLGIAGKKRSDHHARATGEALSRMDPNYVGALSLMLIPDTPLHNDWESGTFELPDAHGMLAELRTMIRHTDLSRGLFHANHASNYLPIRAAMPRDKESTLALLDNALAGNVPLKSEWMRAL